MNEPIPIEEEIFFFFKTLLISIQTIFFSKIRILKKETLFSLFEKRES